jgi:hypothetical protein
MKTSLVVLVVCSIAWAQFDYEYNTSGTVGALPTLVGSNTGWAEYFIVPLQNTTGHALQLMELRFPCCGPATSEFGWVVWDDVGETVAPPAGDATTATYHGAFTPAIASGSVPGDITEYTVIDVSTAGILIAPDACWCFGYDNTMLGGQVSFNGVVTYGWYEGTWDSDEPWGRTGLLEFAAMYEIGLQPATWGEIKTLF